MQRMKKLAFVLIAALMLDSFSPVMSAYAAQENEPVDTVSDGNSYTQDGDETAAVMPQDQENVTATEWPATATALTAGTLLKLYQAGDGSGYGFAFWMKNATGDEETYESIKTWNKTDIRIRVDGGAAYSYSGNVRCGYKKPVTYFGGGFLDNDLSAGKHTVEVAVQREGTWYSGSMETTLVADSSWQTIDSLYTGEYGGYFSSKKGSRIRKAMLRVNAESADDDILLVKLCGTGTVENVATATQREDSLIKYTGYDSHYSNKDVNSLVESGEGIDPSYLLGALPELNVIEVTYDFEMNSDLQSGWYDIEVINKSGMVTVFSAVYYATDKPIIYSVGYRNYEGDMLLPLRTGDYVAAYIYGINITEDTYPIYFKDGRAVTNYIPGHAEAYPYDEGYDFLLEKTDDAVWDSDFGSLELTWENHDSDCMYVGTKARTETLPYGAVYGYSLSEKVMYLSGDWLKGATEVGVAGYKADGTEEYTEACEPHVVDAAGNAYIEYTRTPTAESAMDYYARSYKPYRVVNGTREYGEAIKSLSLDNTKNAISCWQADEPEWSDFDFKIYALGDMTELVSGSCKENQTMDDALSKEGHQAIYGQKFVRVVKSYKDLDLVERTIYTGFTPVLATTATSVTLSKTELSLAKGQKETLTATVLPEALGDKSVTWSTSNKNVATVSDGVVTAVGVGTAKITVKTAKGGKTAVCQVTVVDRVEPLTGISLEKLPTDMEAGALAAFTLSDILIPADTTEIAESNVTWSYEPEGIVKYAEGKGLSALAAGTVTVTAKAKSPATGEEYSASKVVTVAGAFVPVDSITLDQTNVTLQPGAVVTLHAMVSPANANEKTVMWNYDTEYLRLVKEEGTSITLQALYGYGGSSYVEAGTAGSTISAKCEVVVKESDFENEMDNKDVEDNGKNIFIASFESYHYTGKAVKPKVHVYSGSELLKEKTDYTVSYKNNIAATGMGTDKVPQVIVKLKGNYKGTITKNFTILPAEFSDGVVDVTRVCVPYKGKALTPVPVVTYNGKKLGKKDFSVKYYSDPSALEEYETVIDKPGLYYIEVNGEGNYEGRYLQECYVTDPTSTKELLVSKASIKLTKNKFEYDADPEKFGSEIEKAISTDIPVGELGIDVADDEFYTVGKHVLILYGTGTDEDGDGKYYVGEKRFNYTVTGTDLKKATIEFKDGKGSYTYDRSSVWNYEEDIADDFNVSHNGKELVYGADYQIEYQYIENAGKYTLTFRGEGAYTGVVKKTVVVNPVTINMTGEDPEFVISPEVTYEQGGKPEPQVFWMSKGYLLRAGKDYTFSYKKDVLTVKGKGNFTGTVSQKIFFNKQKIWNLTATAGDKVYSTKANAWMSKVVVTDTNGKKLKEGKDYEKLTADSYRYFGSAWKPVPEAGDTVTVTIKGKGNYEGEKEVSYRIVAADIAKAKVKVLDKSYSGSSVTLDAADLEVTIAKEGTLNMVSDDNADGYRIVSYQTNVKVGKATIVLKGCGKYGGTKKVTFKINPKEYVGNIK